MEYVSIVTCRQLSAESKKKDGSSYEMNKNRVYPVQLSVVKGELPGNCLVVDGTVAARIGLSTEGYTLLTAVQTGVDPVYGAQYQLSALPISGVIEYMQVLKSLPSAKIIDTRSTAPNPSVAFKAAEALVADARPFE